jgi:hypothetical protein
MSLFYPNPHKVIRLTRNGCQINFPYTTSIVFADKFPIRSPPFHTEKENNVSNDRKDNSASLSHIFPLQDISGFDYMPLIGAVKRKVGELGQQKRGGRMAYCL